MIFEFDMLYTILEMMVCVSLISTKSACKMRRILYIYKLLSRVLSIQRGTWNFLSSY